MVLSEYLYISRLGISHFASLPKTSQPSFGSFCWTWICWSLPKQLVSNSLKTILAEHLQLLNFLFFNLRITALGYCYRICTATRKTLSLKCSLKISSQLEYMGLTLSFPTTSKRSDKLVPALVTLWQHSNSCTGYEIRCQLQSQQQQNCTNTLLFAG